MTTNLTQVEAKSMKINKDTETNETKSYEDVDVHDLGVPNPPFSPPVSPPKPKKKSFIAAVLKNFKTNTTSIAKRFTKSLSLKKDPPIFGPSPSGLADDRDLGEKDGTPQAAGDTAVVYVAPDSWGGKLTTSLWDCNIDNSLRTDN